LEQAAETADRIARYFYGHSTPYEGAYGDKKNDIIAD